MHALRYRLVALAPLVAVGIAAGPATADDRSGFVRAWLAVVSVPLAAEGYRLSWDGIAPGPGGSQVTVRDLLATDAAGSERLRIATMTLDAPRLGTDGAVRAEALAVEAVEVTGPYGGTVERMVVTRPDLPAIARRLAAHIRQDPATETAPWTRDLAVERLEIRGLRGLTRGADGPLDLRLDRLLVVGAEPGRLRHLEIDGAHQTSREPDGDQVTTSIGEIRAADIEIEPAVYAMADDPETTRPLSALAGIRVGSFETKRFRSESAQTGIIEVDRQWIRTRAYAPGRSGVLSFGNEGMRSRSDGTARSVEPFLQLLFPPNGEVPMHWSGDVAYDVADGFVGYRQNMTIDRFGSFDLQVDVSGVPDLTIGQWREVAKGDPRLQAVLVTGISLALTDAGGIDRGVTLLADDKQLRPAELRAAFAQEFGGLAEAFNPKRDPRLAAWLQVIQDFIRLGGTLALGVTRPIPIGAVDDRPRLGDLTALADRYGLVVARR